MKNTIHVERAIKRMTQADLAEAVGVSRQTINALEASKYVNNFSSNIAGTLGSLTRLLGLG